MTSPIALSDEQVDHNIRFGGPESIHQVHGVLSEFEHKRKWGSVRTEVGEECDAKIADLDSNIKAQMKVCLFATQQS